jgi:hypothetical protein
MKRNILVNPVQKDLLKLKGFNLKKILVKMIKNIKLKS